jgi:hypothetical protein
MYPLYIMYIMYLSGTQTSQWRMRERIILQWNPFGVKYLQLVPLIQGAPVRTAVTATAYCFPDLDWMERNR